TGKYDVETRRVVPSMLEYRAGVVARVRELLAGAQRVNSNTTASDVEWAEGIIEGAKDALATPYVPCVVFEDYKEPNAVVERTADGWRVSGVFDLMTAHFGDGEADLARQVGMYLRENPPLAEDYAQEYLAHKSVAPGFAQRQKFYMLYDSLIIWSFWQQHAGGLPE